MCCTAGNMHDMVDSELDNGCIRLVLFCKKLTRAVSLK